MLEIQPNCIPSIREAVELIFITKRFDPLVFDHPVETLGFIAFRDLERTVRSILEPPDNFLDLLALVVEITESLQVLVHSTHWLCLQNLFDGDDLSDLALVTPLGHLTFVEEGTIDIVGLTIPNPTIADIVTIQEDRISTVPIVTLLSLSLPDGPGPRLGLVSVVYRVRAHFDIDLNGIALVELVSDLEHVLEGDSIGHLI